jgi:hypothetical protein
MAPKKKKSSCKPKVEFSAIIPLPHIKGAHKYFRDFWKKMKQIGVTLSVQNSSLFIAADSREMLEITSGIINREMTKFIESNRSVIKGLSQTKCSHIAVERKRNGKLISRDIILKIRIRDCQYSKQINRILRNKRRYWNGIKMMWKQWYISRQKFNVKFKAISQYFGKAIRQDYRKVSYYRFCKRSRFEYYQQKILGRKRDRLKGKRVHQAKQSIKSRKTKNASTHNPVLGKLSETKPITSKMKFITVDAAKTMRFHLKNKPESHLAMISNGKLGGNYDFSLFPWVDRILINTRDFVIRYYNQRIFIYKASYDTNRPSKQNLVHTFSTLNKNEIKPDWRTTEYTQFAPIKQSSLNIQQNKNSSRKTKPKTSSKALPSSSAVRLTTNDHIPAPVKIKPKKPLRQRPVKTTTKH